MFRSVFAALFYLFRPIIYTPQLFPAYAEDLIGSGVRRSSKEFEKGDLVKSGIRRNSKKFRRTNLIKSGVRRILHKFTKRSVNIKSTLLLLSLNFQYMECLLRRYSIYETDVFSQETL